MQADDSEFVRPRVKQVGVEAEDARDGFFGDLAGADDALEVDVDAPPCEELEEGANDVAGVLEQLQLEQSESAARPHINVSDLFTNADTRQAPTSLNVAPQLAAPPPGLHLPQHAPPAPPGLAAAPPGLWLPPTQHPYQQPPVLPVQASPSQLQPPPHALSHNAHPPAPTALAPPPHEPTPATVIHPSALFASVSGPSDTAPAPPHPADPPPGLVPPSLQPQHTPYSLPGFPLPAPTFSRPPQPPFESSPVPSQPSPPLPQYLGHLSHPPHVPSPGHGIHMSPTAGPGFHHMPPTFPHQTTTSPARSGAPPWPSPGQPNAPVPGPAAPSGTRAYLHSAPPQAAPLHPHLAAMPPPPQLPPGLPGKLAPPGLSGPRPLPPPAGEAQPWPPGDPPQAHVPPMPFHGPASPRHPSPGIPAAGAAPPHAHPPAGAWPASGSGGPRQHPPPSHPRPPSPLEHRAPQPPPAAGASAPPTPQSVASSQRFPVMPPAGRLHAAPPSAPGSARGAPSTGGNLAQQGFGGRSGGGGGGGGGDNFRGRFPGHRMPVLPGLELWVRDYKCMGKREVDEFLLFNMRNLHAGQLYADDFYFQAHVNKHFSGANTAIFRPLELFALAPHERAAADPATHAKVEGLGKFVFSSLRAPRQLLSVEAPSPSAAAAAAPSRARGQEKLLAHAKDAAAAGEAGDTAGGASGAAEEEESDAEEEVVLVATARRREEPAAAEATAERLNAAPKVAARKVIEDCDCQLLDVDDLDRTSAAEAAAGGAAPPADAVEYREQRRLLLMDGIADAFSASADGPARDGVFRYCMELPKGRRVVARVLRRMFGAASGSRAQGARVLHALLRNARRLFGDNVRPEAATGVVVSREAHLVESTVSAALEVATAVRRMRAPADVLATLEAVAESDMVAEAAVVRGAGGVAAEDAGLRGVLPLLLLNHEYVVDTATPWLGAMLIAVFDAAREHRLRDGGGGGGGGGGGDGDTTARFEAAFAAVFDRFVLHVEALGALVRTVAGGPQAAAAVESLGALAASDVLHALISLCTKQEEVRLAEALQVLLA